MNFADMKLAKQSIRADIDNIYFRKDSIDVGFIKARIGKKSEITSSLELPDGFPASQVKFLVPY